ncbi:MAG: diguanylate cyclase, partial [Gammaproteobacteria bacterium]|nr:diguanylate cyclase [Gammaproteobacteria bacterium]
MTDKNISIRNRFLAIIAVFFSLFLIFALYTDKAARVTVEDSQLQIRKMQEVGITVGDISNTLHMLGIAMYQATLFDKNDHPEILQIQLETLANQINRLISFPSVKSNPEFYQPALILSENLQALTVHANTMLEISADYELKYPAMPIMLENLRPINREMVGLIISSIDEAREELGSKDEQEKILALYRDIRYVWSQLVSSVRVFVANRLGAFGPPEKTMNLIQRDRQLYADVITDLLSQLDEINQNGALGLVQQDALTRMKLLHHQYQIYFMEAAKIYLSENWRADKTLLRDELDPALEVAWSQVYLISTRVNAHSQISMNRYATTADTLSNYIWIATTITMCLLILGYFSFEYIIRRPIIDIALALEAEGKGDSFVPRLKFRVKETLVLLQAFADMRNQVRSRQSRLQSILDNAGEGILTLSTNGKIEGANKAACYLFGYQESELINLDATKVIPAYLNISSKHKINQLVGSNIDREKVLPEEQEVLGRCKNGRMFPMSLRLGQSIIEETEIFTALVSDISERKIMIDRLTQLAERDSLTGLYNRHFLMDELERIVDRSARGEKQHIALLYIDLDHFKYVNDTLGHIAGDKVLQEVTRILEKRARGTDLVTRLGGDEFAILLYDVDELQAKATASAYRKQMADYVFRYEGKAVDVGC